MSLKLAAFGSDPSVYVLLYMIGYVSREAAETCAVAANPRHKKSFLAYLSLTQKYDILGTF